MAVVHIDSGNFDAEIVKSKLPVLVDFWAAWCGPCRMMGPVFEELSGVYAGKLKFAKVNCDDEPDISGRYSIQGIPCLVLMKAGKEIERIVGFMPKDALKSRIDELMAK